VHLLESSLQSVPNPIDGCDSTCASFAVFKKLLTLVFDVLERLSE